MKLLRFIAIVILIGTVGLVWFQKTFPERWEHLFYPLEYETSIIKASNTYKVDPYLICGIIYVESKFNPSSESDAGAVGLMQVMPDTGEWIAFKQGAKFTPSDLDDPTRNIDMGTWYFSYLEAKYGNEKLALAAYNSGYKNVDRWVKTTKFRSIDEVVANIPYKETRSFITRVKRAQAMYKKLYPTELEAASHKQRQARAIR